MIWSVFLLCGLTFTGGAKVLRDLAEHAAALVPLAARPTFAVVVFVVLLGVLNELGGLPLGLYSGFILERRYGLSRQSIGEWLLDQGKSMAVGLILGAVAASLAYFFIRRSPSSWWLPAGLLFGTLIVGLANLGPVLLLPLFYRIRPLEREPLKARLLTLADRAGARVLDAYEWGLSAKTRKANAALAGFGATKRILVSDTMLAEYSDDEIEIVLAHEIAHHVHGDLWKGIALESALVLAGFFAAARALESAAHRVGLRSPADVAGLPLLLLAAGAVSLIVLPASHALSRADERRADRFALELTRNPRAFVSAIQRLATQNLAEEYPSRLVQLLFHSHPPIHERVAAARRYGGEGVR